MREQSRKPCMQTVGLTMWGASNKWKKGPGLQKGWKGPRPRKTGDEKGNDLSTRCKRPLRG